MQQGQKNRTVKNHSHKYYELVYYISGKGKTQIGGKVFPFSNHWFTLIPPDTEHSELHYEDSEVIFIEFSCESNLEFCFDKDETFVILKVLKKLLTEMQQQHFGYKDMFTIKLNEIIISIARNKMNSPNTKNLEYIINYIDENFHEHINLSDCAKQLNLSYDYFQHKFKAFTGYSPQQYLIKQRLLAAEKMLFEGNLNCTEIAYRCGFCTSAQFTTLFKKKYGLTPMQFKKEKKYGN